MDLIEVDNIISEIEGYVFVEKGVRCSLCDEEFLDEKESRRTIEVGKQDYNRARRLVLHRVTANPF